MIIPSFSLHKYPFFVKPQDSLAFTTSVRRKMWDLYFLAEDILEMDLAEQVSLF